MDNFFSDLAIRIGACSVFGELKQGNLMGNECVGLRIDCGDRVGKYKSDQTKLSEASDEAKSESSFFEFGVNRFEIQSMPAGQEIAINNSSPLPMSDNDGFFSGDFDAAFSICSSDGNCTDAGIDLSWIGAEDKTDMVSPFNESEGWSFHHKSEDGLDVFLDR